MKIKISKNSRGEIKTPLGTYHRALENCNNIFYVNYNASDPNHQVMMFDNKRRLISEDKKAKDELIRCLENQEFSWRSTIFKQLFG